MKMPFWEVVVWSVLFVIIILLLGLAVGGRNILTFFDDNISALAVLIASFATIVAVYFGFHTAHISAVLRVAEFRQNWINSLRDDLARFHSIGITPNRNPIEDSEFYEIGTRIELRMNPSDPDYDELIEAMYRHLNSAHGSVEEKYQNNPEFVIISQRILKREWDRLKKDVRARDI